MYVVIYFLLSVVTYVILNYTNEYAMMSVLIISIYFFINLYLIMTSLTKRARF